MRVKKECKTFDVAKNESINERDKLSDDICLVSK